MKRGLAHGCVAEILGTFLLVFFGTGSVFVAVTTGALQGLFQVAVVWGLAIAITIYALSPVSGAHINPAVTLAAWATRKFPARKVAPFIPSQLLGAVLASAVLASALLLSLFSGIFSSFESSRGIVRGQPGSERSAMVFGEYFPNPGIVGVSPGDYAKVSHTQAMAGEAVGTALLVFFVFALTGPHNANRPNGTLFALFIGMSVAILISIIAPLTQAGFNPARDFGPRIIAWFAGWKDIAIPGPRGGFSTVYILSPIVGGVIGGFAYEWLFGQPHHKAAPVVEQGKELAEL